MKDEELAEEYVKGNGKVYYHPNGVPIFTREEEMKFAFLAGLKIGRLQWHDLRKNPNDLPEKENKFESKLVYISYPDGDTDFAYYEFPNKEWYRLFNDEPTISPIAWCERPTFDKE